MEGRTETTVEAGLRLLKSSNPYKLSGGNLEAGWVRYKKSNPGEHSRLVAYLSTCVTASPNHEAPNRPAQDFVTSWAQGWAFIAEGGLPFREAPPVQKLVVGAILVTAGNMPVEWLDRVEFTHVCTEVSANNLAELSIDAKWGHFIRGGFYVSRGLIEADKAAIAAILDDPQNDFLEFFVVDTEALKDDQFPGDGMAAQDGLFGWLGSEVANPYNITFVRHQDATVVNHQSMKDHDIEYLGEAYLGGGPNNPDGWTDDVAFCVAKMQALGWEFPHVCLGDKGLTDQVVEVTSSLVRQGEVGGVWFWAPEQTDGEILKFEGKL